jgi:hypothetical protein
MRWRQSLHEPAAPAPAPMLAPARVDVDRPMVPVER